MNQTLPVFLFCFLIINDESKPANREAGCPQPSTGQLQKTQLPLTRKHFLPVIELLISLIMEKGHSAVVLRVFIIPIGFCHSIIFNIFGSFCGDISLGLEYPRVMEAISGKLRIGMVPAMDVQRFITLWQ